MWPEVSGHPGLNQFFLAVVGSVEQLRREIFYLAYHLHWAYEEIMSLETGERREFLRLLTEQLEREKQAVDQARPRGA